MTVRGQQQTLAGQSIANVLQGLQIPGIERGRAAETALTEARTAELGNKVPIVTPHGIIEMSPDKAGTYAIAEMGLSLEAQRNNLQSALNAAQIGLMSAETTEKRTMLQPKIDEMQKRLELVDSQIKTEEATRAPRVEQLKALSESMRESAGLTRERRGEYQDVDTGETYPDTGLPIKRRAKTIDLMTISAGIDKAHITAAEKRESRSMAQDAALARKTKRLTELETKLQPGPGRYQGDPPNEKNPANIPGSKEFNQMSSTPYFYGWSRSGKKMQKIGIPALPAEIAYKLAKKPMPPEAKGTLVQLTAKDIYGNPEMLEFFTKYAPKYMGKFGVKDANDFRDSLL